MNEETKAAFFSGPKKSEQTINHDKNVAYGAPIKGRTLTKPEIDLEEITSITAGTARISVLVDKDSSSSVRNAGVVKAVGSGCGFLIASGDDLLSENNIAFFEDIGDTGSFNKVDTTIGVGYLYTLDESKLIAFITKANLLDASATAASLRMSTGYVFLKRLVTSAIDSPQTGTIVAKTKGDNKPALTLSANNRVNFVGAPRASITFNDAGVNMEYFVVHISQITEENIVAA